MRPPEGGLPAGPLRVKEGEAMSSQRRTTPPEHHGERETPASTKRPRVRTDEEPSGSEAKVPLTLKVPESAAMRLKVHSLAVGRTASDVVAELIETHLTKYHITERGE